VLFRIESDATTPESHRICIGTPALPVGPITIEWLRLTSALASGYSARRATRNLHLGMGEPTDVTDDLDDQTDDVDLQEFRTPVLDDSGLSLEALSQAYASLLEKGDDPYEKAKEQDATAADTPMDYDEADDEPLESDLPPVAEKCDITPRTIVESMLFVGHPENEPLTSEVVASFMRGVRPREVDQLIVELNEAYRTEGCPFEIESVGAGYRMTLREEFGSLRDKFYGRAKAARLSQAAIDVLAVVAYKQPLTREDVDTLRGKSSGSLLSQLVRRELLRVERTNTKPRVSRYYTTERFLALFGIEDVRDLPSTPD